MCTQQGRHAQNTMTALRQDQAPTWHVTHVMPGWVAVARHGGPNGTPPRQGRSHMGPNGALLPHHGLLPEHLLLLLPLYGCQRGGGPYGVYGARGLGAHSRRHACDLCPTDWWWHAQTIRLTCKRAWLSSILLTHCRILARRREV